MQILILGATGILGQPVTRCLINQGHRVRVLTRSVEKARRIFENTVETVEGKAAAGDRLRTRRPVASVGGRLPWPSLGPQASGGWWPRHMMMVGRLASGCSFTGRRASRC